MGWTSRVNLYYSYKHQVNEQVLISSTTYLQPSIDQSNDLRGLFTVALLVKLSKTLDLKVSYKLDHDSQPAEFLKKTDTRYSTSLVYSF